MLIQNILKKGFYKENGKLLCNSVHLTKPSPSVDGGKARLLAVMANHCQLQSNETSNIKEY